MFNQMDVELLEEGKLEVGEEFQLKGQAYAWFMELATKLWIFAHHFLSTRKKLQDLEHH